MTPYMLIQLFQYLISVIIRHQYLRNLFTLVLIIDTRSFLQRASLLIIVTCINKVILVLNPYVYHSVYPFAGISKLFKGFHLVRARSYGKSFVTKQSNLTYKSQVVHLLLLRKEDNQRRVCRRRSCLVAWNTSWFCSACSC